MGAFLPRSEAQLGQFRQKINAVCLSPLCAAAERGIKVSLPLRSQLGKPVCGKSIDRGPKHRYQRNILAGIVHHLEQRQRHLHLRRPKEVPVPVGLPGDPLFIQRPGIVVDHRSG